MKQSLSLKYLLPKSYIFWGEFVNNIYRLDLLVGRGEGVGESYLAEPKIKLCETKANSKSIIYI